MIRWRPAVRRASLPPLTDTMEADLNHVEGLLNQVRMLLDDHQWPDGDFCDHLRAWCSPEHDQAVAAMRRLRVRLAPPEQPEPPTLAM